ncbi:putative uncharacterized protein DDB_G0282499 [Eurosta solidaginis]|uniref:putative uncharacterized protein DDB_G0282499 n=1 Tax=Eurosta solidaginis TaxID=178769 RepID=UPI003530CEF7
MEGLDINVRFKLITANINNISSFNGDRDALLIFLQRIDSMVPILDSFPLDYRCLIMGSVKDKIVGDARRSLLVNGNADNWPDIKQILIDNHGEKDSVYDLIDKIRTCRCDSTIENFYKKLNTLLCRLNNALYFSNENNPVINSNSNARIALHTFKHGLPEPVKSIIISRNPSNLKEAFDVIKKNGYLMYTTNSHYSVSNRAQHVGNVQSADRNVEHNRSRQQHRQDSNRYFNDIGSRANVRNNLEGNRHQQHMQDNRYFNEYPSRGNEIENGNGRELRQNPNTQTSMQSRRAHNSNMQAVNGNRNVGRYTFGHTNNSQNSYINNTQHRNDNESMEIGTNEMMQNFQALSLEDYPI